MTYGVDPSQQHPVPQAPDLGKTPGQAPPPFGQVPPHDHGQQQPVPGYGQQPAGAPAAPFGTPVQGMAPPAGYGAVPGYGVPAGHGMPVAGAGPQTIRPSTEQYRKFVGSGPIAAVILLVILYFRYGVVAMIVGLVVAVIALGGALLYIQRTALRMDAGSVEHRHLFGTRRFAPADVSEVVLAPFQASAQDRRVLLTLLLRDRGGRKLLRISSSMWKPEDLERLAHSFGVTPRIHDELLNTKKLEAYHPGSTTWVERHPMLLALVIVVVIVVAVVIGVIAFG